MSLVTISIKCPKCHLEIEAAVLNKKRSFLIYTCPGCKQNVAWYENRIITISNQLLKKLQKRGLLELENCGTISTRKRKERTGPITEDEIINLRITLAKENDVNRIISRL